MIYNRTLISFAVAAFALAGAGHAQSTRIAPPPEASAPADLSDGEIRKVDRDNKKLTIKHGPLKNLDMPGMTMVFSVSDEAVLEKLQSGEKIRFKAEKINGAITVTDIERAP